MSILIGLIHRTRYPSLTLKVWKKLTSLSHTREGLERLKEKHLQIAKNPQWITCIIETKHELLIQFLPEEGFTVYSVNLKVVDRRRKPSGAKSDPLDARILADVGITHINKLRPLKPD
ncbi:MAG: IS110 family transposase [Tepidanaerobacteraceae bacterium]